MAIPGLVNLSKREADIAVTLSAPREGRLVSRRLLVYENQVVVNLAQGIPAGGVDARYAYQQLNFSINYSAAELLNPAAEVKVILRQNYRWDNANYNLRPTFVRDADRVLEYQYFNYENAFPGLSEYRYFDARSLQANGLGVARTVPRVYLSTFKVRVDRCVGRRVHLSRAKV